MNAGLFYLDWYRTHGKYPSERIVRAHSGTGEEYVIGDWSWNLLHPDKHEVIERQMESSLFANCERA